MLKRILIAAPLLLALGACGGPKGGVFAARKGTPNEFVVGRAAPLVVPPDYALVPPRPGAPRPQEADSSTQALNAMFGGQSRSAAETALIQQTGAAPQPGIRAEAGSPDTAVVNKGSATRDLLKAPPSSNPQASAGTTPAPAAPAAPPKP